MPINIKSRSTSKTGTSSRTSRSTGGRSRSTTKTTGKTTTPRSTRKPAAQTTEPTPRAAKPPEGMTAAELRKMVAKAEKLGAQRDKTREAWDAAVEEIHEYAAEMLEADVSMAVVSRATGISRQWLYKIAEKVNGSTTTAKKKPARKPAAKRAATKKPAARRTSTTKTTTRRSTRGTSKPAASTRRGGIKIRSGR